MRLQDIGAGVRLPPSTVLRFLKTFIDHGYVKQNRQSLRYHLTLKICQVSERVKRQVKVHHIAHPLLEELSQKLGEATSLAIADDGKVVYVDVVEGPDHMLRTLQRIGKMAPMNTTGVGKVLMQNYAQREIDQLIALHGLPKPTPKTIGSKRALVNELASVRSLGYAVDNEECEMGVCCVAAPVRDYSGAIVAAVSTSGPVGRMNEKRLRSVIPQVVAAADEISRQLGYGARVAATSTDVIAESVRSNSGA